MELKLVQAHANTSELPKYGAERQGTGLRMCRGKIMAAGMADKPCLWYIAVQVEVQTHKPVTQPAAVRQLRRARSWRRNAASRAEQARQRAQPAPVGAAAQRSRAAGGRLHRGAAGPPRAAAHCCCRRCHARCVRAPPHNAACMIAAAARHGMPPCKAPEVVCQRAECPQGPWPCRQHNRSPIQWCGGTAQPG